MAVPADWSIMYTRSSQGGGSQGGPVIAAHDICGVCPYCRYATTFSLQSQVYVMWHDRSTDAHLVLSCQQAQCRKTLYIQTVVANGAVKSRPSDEFYMYPPIAINTAHVSIPVGVAEDWREAQRTLQASAPKATAVMLRRVLYSILIDKGCKLRPIKDGLKQLIEEQRLPAIFDDWLTAISDDGHDGAHPDRALQVSAENVVETMEYTAEVLRFLYIEPYEFLQRKNRNAQPPTAAPIP